MKRAARNGLLAALVVALLAAPLVLGNAEDLPRLLRERFIDTPPSEFPPPPSVLLFSPKNGTGQTSDVVVEGEARAGVAAFPITDVQLRVDGEAWQSLPDAPRGLVVSPFRVPLSLPEGDHVVEVRATDGNWTSAIARALVRVGTPAPPSLAILSPVEGQGLVTGEVDVRGTIEGEGPHRVFVQHGNQRIPASILAADGRGALWSARIGLAHGIRTIAVRGDGGGGEAMPRAVTVALHERPPATMSLLKPETGSAFGTAGSADCPDRCIAFAGVVASEGLLAGVKVSVDNNAWRWVNGSLGATFVPGPVSAWSWPLSTRELFTGEHRARFVGVDRDGLEGAPREVVFHVRTGRSLLIVGDDAPLETDHLLSFRMCTRLFDHDRDPLTSDECLVEGIRSAAWSLDGAHLANGTSVSLRLLTPGDHTLGLNVTDASGGGAQTQLPLFALNRKPTVTGIEGLGGVATLPIEIAASASDPDGVVSAYSWSFGDGSVALTEAPTVTHRFPFSGDFTVTVVAVDDLGAQSLVTEASTLTVHVTNHPPQADFTYAPEAPSVLDDVVFDGFGFDPDGRIVSFDWDFGDGTRAASRLSVVHRFAERGPHEVRLKVRDAQGATWEALRVVDVTNLAPQAAFLAQPALPQTKQEVTFRDASVKPDGDVVSWSWDFGDGNVSFGRTVHHAYEAPGTYLVKLSVEDDRGARGAVVTPLVVADARPLVRAILPDPREPQALDAVRFRAVAIDLEGAIARLEWDFGDGTNSTEAEPVHRYARSGAYNVTAAAYDAAGQRGVANVTLVVADHPPIAAFGKADGQYATYPIILRSASSDPDGRIVRTVFDMDGDGRAECDGPGLDCRHAYSKPGLYRVFLAVTDDEGETSFAELALDVLAPPSSIAPPLVRIQLPEENATIRGDTQVRGFAFAVSPVRLVEVQVRNDTWSFAPSRDAWAIASGTDEWLLFLDTRGLPDGEFRIAVRVTDENGGRAESEVPVFIANGLKPNAVSLAATNLQEGQKVEGEMTVRGVAYHPSGVTSIRWRLDESAWRPADGNNLAWSVPLSTRGLAPGTHRLQVDAYHGIADRASLMLPFHVPDTRPFLFVDAPPGPVAYGKLHAEGRAGEGGRVVWRVDGGLWREAEGRANWTLDVSTKEWRGGPHHVSFKSVDEESGAESESLTFPVRFLSGEVNENDLRVTTQAREASGGAVVAAVLALALAAVGRRRA